MANAKPITPVCKTLPKCFWISCRTIYGRINAFIAKLLDIGRLDCRKSKLKIISPFFFFFNFLLFQLVQDAVRLYLSVNTISAGLQSLIRKQKNDSKSESTRINEAKKANIRCLSQSRNPQMCRTVRDILTAPTQQQTHFLSKTRVSELNM